MQTTTPDEVPVLETILQGQRDVTVKFNMDKKYLNGCKKLTISFY